MVAMREKLCPKIIVEGTRAEVVADPRTREVYLGH